MTTDPKPMTLDQALASAIRFLDSDGWGYEHTEAAAVLRKFRENAEEIVKVAKEVYDIGALLKTPPPRDFYRLAARLLKAVGMEG